MRVLEKNKKYELVTPRGCSNVDICEMTYIEGGYRASRSVYMQAGSRRMSTTTFCAEAGAVAAIVGKLIGVISSSIAPGGAVMSAAAKAIWGTALKGAVGIAIAARADYLDGLDGKDGMLTISWGGHYVTEYNPYPPNSYQGAMF